ncbi:MAG: zinc-binding alcohol dehydrogenase [Clostridia bacterium]|nr:zinc-binding alcohol dehydrogenase [Clostridia bacterium]
MKNKQILFTDIHKAELAETDVRELDSCSVLVRTEYTVISGGTERACLMGMPNTPQKFPMSLGYCGVGYVEAVGEDVKKVSIGDRVLVYHGVHAKYNVVPESDVTLVENEKISSLEASFVIIASMGLGGVRKLELELGESAMVMGLGLLGIFAIQFLRASGANPLIAADPNPERRKLALELGADYAFDPSDEDFSKKVMEVTKGKGVRACVEVTGISKAMNQALECASYMGRISLLGCTRVSDSGVDYYNQVHRPGVKLIGAHNFVRPKSESYPHHWTHHDDCNAIIDLIVGGRIQVNPIISRVVSPTDASEIYNELCDSKIFPLGTVFDWRNM